MLEKQFKGIKNYIIKFWTSTSSAHGVLRLVLELAGEVVERADPHYRIIT